jgi:hypothetical protein
MIPLIPRLIGFLVPKFDQRFKALFKHAATERNVLNARNLHPTSEMNTGVGIERFLYVGCNDRFIDTLLLEVLVVEVLEVDVFRLYIIRFAFQAFALE